MNLLSLLEILKGWQTITIMQRVPDQEEKEKSGIVEHKVYTGKVNDFNPHLNEIKNLSVDSVFFGYYDTVNITVR